MKINKFLLGAFALSVGFASCSNEEPIKGNDVAQADETRFMSVQISAPSQTSRGYENGTANESELKSLGFLFFDAAGNPTAQYKIIDLTATGDFTIGGIGTDGENVTRIATSVVPIELVQGENLPAQVICFVNADPTQIQKLEKMNLDDLRDEKRDYFNNNEEFIMSNSVYFGRNTITGESNARLCASPINSNTQLFPTKEAAIAAITAAGADGASEAAKAALVDIYVERLAAKVGLTMPANAARTYTLKNGDGDGDITLTYAPEYWFMNATANQTFITKRYGLDKDGVINYKPTFTEIDEQFEGTGMANAWNSLADHRSFWGCSPSYYEVSYPLVSDQVNNLEEGKQTEEGNTYYNTYYSYDEVVAAANNGPNIARQACKVAEDGSFSIVNTGSVAKGYIYSRETTTAISVIKDVNRNPAAAVASAVIVGRYTAEGIAPNTTFFIDRNNGEKGTFYSTEASALKVLYDRQTILFADINGQNSAPQNVFKLMHPTSVTRAKLVNPYIAGRLVTIQLDGVPQQPLYFWNGTEYTPVTAENLAQVNAQLVSVGYMDKFHEGLAFFNIPIRHLGFDASVCIAENGNYEWDAMRLGDLGLVRNHVYTINVTSMTGLGTGLRDPEQPIIPAKETVNQYIAMRLNVLAWNVVQAWNVPL